MKHDIKNTGARTTASDQEVAKFSAIAKEWWDRNGKFKMLHVINPLRLRFITQNIFTFMNRQDLKDLKILDIGCGGGLVSVPLAKIGAQVTGVDASEENIKVAQQYVRDNNIPNVIFECATVETLAINSKFDVVLALEVIEHVSNIDLFLAEISKRLKPGGVVIISTINRTLKSMLAAKIGAEYILRWVPIGTHSWSAFVKPEEIAEKLEKNFTLKREIGMKYNPLQSKWYLKNGDLGVNYLVCYQKNH